MKTTRKTILAITLVLAAFSLPLLAQDIGSDGKDSASLETLKQDLLKLGNDLKITASEAPCSSMTGRHLLPFRQ